MDDLLKKTLGSEVVRYYPGLANCVGGATTGLMLSQLLYWHYNPKMQDKLKNKDGWFYISVEDMKEQTGLTRYEQETAKRNLTKLKILETRFQGRSPRTTHYHLDIKKLNELVSQSLENPHTSVGKTSSLVWGKPAHFNTDTTDTTQKLTGSEKTAAPVEGKADKDKSNINHYPLASTLAEITGTDINLNRGKLFKMAQNMHKQGVTPDALKAEYGPGGRWYRQDWRGQKGQKPTPEQIIATWGTMEDKGVTTGAFNVESTEK